ncbi:unnamed protein product [Rhizophagus irregularis]|nr:unnamed protein product [Rhizophagus irregularis]
MIMLFLDYSNRIIRCLGISLDPIKNDYLLIMQYADSSDLQNYLKDNFKNLTWDDKKKLAFQIADGLNYLHNENILHRDLHSKNIVIHEHNAKITDFDCDNKVALAFEINNGVREVTIPDTPIEYEGLYKNCWNQAPEQRPTTNKVLDEFEKMGFGINTRNKSIKNNENLDPDSQSNNESSAEYTQSSDQCIKLNY